MNPHSIKFRLMALLVGLFGAAMLVRVLVAFPLAEDSLEQMAHEQQLAHASYLARDLDEALRARQTLLAALSADLPLDQLKQPARLEAWLAARQRLAPQFDRGLALLPLDAGPLAGPAEWQPGRTRQRHHDTEWFKRALGSNGVVISRLLRQGGEACLIFASALRDADGKPLAVLAGGASLSAANLLGRLDGYTLARQSSLLVAAPEEGVYVGATDPALRLAALPVAGQNALHDRAMAGFRGTGVSQPAQGAELLDAIASIPSTGWFVVARTPMSDALTPVINFKRFVFGAGALIGVLLLVLFMLALPRVLRPLELAGRAMRDMADGRRELAPLPISTEDEVGGMLAGFNHLVQRLRDKEAALAASEARMSYIAHHDALTGLYNRAMLDEHLQQAIARATRDPSVFAVLFIDLDGFKPVNDTHGHDVGDAVLVEMARRLGQGRRRTDTVARQGGDEFVVLLADLEHGRSDAEAIARHYLLALAAPVSVGSLQLRLSASIGVAVYHGTALSASQLLSRADTAMYAAKRAGKNQLCVYEEAIDAALAARA